MNWREKIEEQIAMLRNPTNYSAHELPTAGQAADSLQALLDVAVAAETYERLDNTNARLSMRRALDKLREVGDE